MQKICPQCNQPFVPLCVMRVYCTQKCADKAQYRRLHPDVWKPAGALVCPGCNKEFTPFRQNQQYCDRKCARKAKEKRSPKIKKSRAARAQRANRSRRIRNADIVIAVKLKSVCPCGRCDSDPDVLLFHHRNPETKCFSIAWAVKSGVSEIRLLEEIAKCDVICSNYHIKIHKAQKTEAIRSEFLDPQYKKQTEHIERHRQNNYKVRAQ